MSKILRRPMFRGGPVDSRGTGITSGLMDGGRVGYKKGDLVTGGDLMNKNRFSYFDPNALPGFRSVKRALPINDIIGSKDSSGMQLGGTDYLVEKGYLSDVEKPVSEMSMEELIDYQLGEKGDVFQTGKSGLEKDRPRQVKSTADLTEDELREYRTTGMTSKNKALEGTSSRPVEVIETDDKGGIKLVTDPTGNVEESTEAGIEDIKAQAELFKEILSADNKKKLKDARISDASDYLLKFFEGSQREGATVGSAAADVAAFATSKDSKTERAKAAIEKTDQTASALAINDYISGKKSKAEIAKIMKLAEYKSDLAAERGKKNVGEYIMSSKELGFSNKVKEGVQAKYGPRVFEEVTSEIMSDSTKFKPDESDIGKVYIETDTKTVYTFDKDGNRIPIYQG
jgi:hypothetical protein